MTPPRPLARALPQRGAVHATLRPYQREGVAWLLWIDDVGPGGILADDMGLGKTLQCIAAMSAVEASRPSFRALVVTTSSTVHNWAREVAQFAPHLRVAVWAGPNRRTLAHEVFSPRTHVVVTSYDVARVDLALLAEQPAYDWLLLDEAQAIKNGSSRRAQVARSIPAHRRFVLTGTPIENGVGDLHSLASFAVPHVLGTEPWFHETYGQRLKEGDTEAADTVQRVLAPYFLRRLKRDVAKDLPEKTETTRLVPLPAAHRAIYDQVEASTREALSGIDTEGEMTQGQRMAVFAALTRLRQVACDPRLVGIPYGGAGKLRELVSLVRRSRASGQKTLVFSSFAKMVDLLATDLTRFGFGVLTLTGETPQDERMALLDRFARDSTRDVFLITLKAGGAGLNITSASTVVHFDPWWNPAAEDQATDRAHRIGQKRPVTVYKLLAERTIEQRVTERVGEKRALASLLLGSGTTDAELALGASDLLQLLRTRD